jgi:fatty acid desaturase
MRAPLRTIMVTLWAACVTGAVLTLLLAMGWVTWVSFVISAVIGLAVGVPAGLWSAKAIKRDDPNWPPRSRRTRPARPAEQGICGDDAVRVDDQRPL